MRIPKGQGFSIHFKLFNEHLSDKAFRLVVYLYSVSSCKNRCSPGYAAMMHATCSSRPTVARALAELREKGWIYAYRKNGSAPATFLLRLPRKLNPRKLNPMDMRLVPGKIVLMRR